MKIENRPDGEIRWILASGWSVNPKDSLYFVAPDGVIYDRCEWLLISRSKINRLPKSLHLTDIFTDEEYEEYLKNFS